MSKILFIFLVWCFSAYAQDTTQEGENLYFPCESTDDWECIRDFLASNGQCNKVSLPDGTPISEYDQYSYAPKFNISLHCLDTTKITFFDTKILNFYLNRDTNNLVMTIDLGGINQDSPTCNIIIDRVGKEPLVAAGYLNITYSATITVVVAWSDHIQNEDIYASGFLKEPYPNFFIDPVIVESSNPVVQTAYQNVLGDLPTVLEELWLTKAYYYTCLFINNKLCDFGLVYDGRINRK